MKEIQVKSLNGNFCLSEADMKEKAFLDKSLVERWYDELGGYHKVYVVEILKSFEDE